jgi:hypothetical protein
MSCVLYRPKDISNVPQFLVVAETRYTHHYFGFSGLPHPNIPRYQNRYLSDRQIAVCHSL